MTVQDHYLERMHRARDHIEAHLGDATLDTARLSEVAAYSKYHFHRQFLAVFGLSVHRYIQLARMRHAAFRLAHTSAAVSAIAFDAGYETPEAFARAFRKLCGYAPTDFRRSPDWSALEDALYPLNRARKTVLRPVFSTEQVSITEFPSTRVAMMLHKGRPDRIHESIQAFVAWRRANGLTRQETPTFTVFFGDPRTTPPEEFRLGLCAGLPVSVEPRDDRIETTIIPQGRCAVIRIIGHTEGLEDAARFLYRTWLPQSGETLRDFPLFCQRLTFFPDVPETETMVDLFLPLTSPD